LGFTWWPISQAIAKGWDELCNHVLKPGRFKQTVTDKGKTTTEYELSHNTEKDYSRGPFPDSSSDIDYGSYKFLISKPEKHPVDEGSFEDLRF
jgi:hypothetical protein